MSPSLLSQLSTFTPSQYLHLSIFLSYLLSILGLLGLILYSILRLPRPKTGENGRALARLVFAGTALASGGNTWFYMIKFLQHSYFNHLAAHPPSATTPFLLKFASWLQATSLFDEAWRFVCTGPTNWWWSQHICLFTIPWTAFVAVEGRRHALPHLWAYALLGQAMAISTASALFFLALFSSPVLDPPVSRARLGLQTYLPILAAVAPVLYTPYLSPAAFMPNLLLLHSLLLVPFLPLEKLFDLLGLSAPAALSDPAATLAPSALLALLEPLLFVARGLAMLVLPSGASRSPSALVSTLLSHPAQASIGFDALHCSLGLIFYSLLRRGALPSAVGVYEALGAVAGVLTVGPGVVAPLVFRGGVRERKKVGSKGEGEGKVGGVGQGGEEDEEREDAQHVEAKR